MTVYDLLEESKEIGEKISNEKKMESFEDDKEEIQRGLRENIDELSGGSTGPSRGRILYCRKCEGHGKQSILKSHGPVCPYRFCKCSSVRTNLDR